MNEIHYAANGTDDFDPEVKVSQEKTGTDAMGEIGLAEAMEETECKLCDGTRKDSAGKKCQECSSDYDVFGND